MSEQAPTGESPLVFQDVNTETTGRKYRFRPLTGLTNTVLAFGLFKCLTALAALIALAHQWQLLAQIGGHMFPSREAMTTAANASDRAVRATSVFFLVALLVTYIASGMWIYRAACNVRAFGARRLTNTPGWAVGWYLVPFASLIKPFNAMVEIWNASRSPDRWRTLPTPDLLRWWWGLWLSLGLFGYVLAATSRMGVAIPTLILTTQAGMLNMAIDIVASAAFLSVVWRIARMQGGAQATVSQTAAVFG
jgi:hypothetical protein